MTDSTREHPFKVIRHYGGVADQVARFATRAEAEAYAKLRNDGGEPFWFNVSNITTREARKRGV